ncbi:hypothetical protein GCM10023317_00240 [Actinopolymorpha pittospori]
MSALGVAVLRTSHSRDWASEAASDRAGSASAADQSGWLGHQRSGDLHLLPIAAVSKRLTDDICVAGIGLRFTAVGVMGEPGDVVPGAVAGPQAHVEGVQGEVGTQTGGHLPAHDHAGEHVELKAA